MSRGAEPDPPRFRMDRIKGRLTLVQEGVDAPITVDFLAGPGARRGQAIRRRDHPLARAVGRKQPLPDILDATAGLGRDAFVLACLGYQVRAIERIPEVFELLSDGHARLLASPFGRAMVEHRFQIELGDSLERLRRETPRVVYLDPMFPERQRSAKVKKEMALLQRLLGPDPDTADLLAAARTAATDRVVVKRPTWAPPVAEAPSFAVAGRKVRWDVYLR